MEIRNYIDSIKRMNESTSTNFGKYFIKEFDPINDIEDKEFIIKNSQILIKFMDDGYKEAGEGNYTGCQGHKDLIKKSVFLRVAYSEDNTMIALSFYSGYLLGKKCVGITATTDEKYRDLGKLAVQDIIKQDIARTLDFFWCECSGAIEYFYGKFNGIRIPVEFANNYLINSNITKLDEYHYQRQLNNNKIVTKCVFGFNSPETFNKVYDELKEKLDNDLEKIKKEYLNENRKYKFNPDEVDYAIDVLGLSFDYTEYLNYYEYPQYYIDLFNTQLLVLKMANIKYKNIDFEDVNRVYTMSNERLSYAMPLELHHYVGNESIYSNNKLVVENKE